MLDDGTYDAIIVDVTRVEDANDAMRAQISVELAITSGAYKGDVVALRAPAQGFDEVELLGLPATLIVEEGVPRVRFED